MKPNAMVRRPAEGCIQLVMAGLLIGGSLLTLLALLWPSLLPESESGSGSGSESGSGSGSGAGAGTGAGRCWPRKQAPDSQEQGSLGGHGRVRQFAEHGRVSALFVQMGAFRGGDKTFAVVGLSSRRLHDVGNPWFHCAWEEPGEPEVLGTVEVMKPDWQLGRIYTVLVLNCTFPRPVGTSRPDRGGSLLLTAGYGDSDRFSPPETFTALQEAPGEYNPRLYSGEDPPPFDFLYCGSPLFGDLSPQQIREWMAYHVRLFGPRSLFVLHDAGGVNDGVRRVIEPWERLGRVLVENVRNQARYDGYYFNQFLVLNDCLHRARFLAPWVFFFDVDEYVAVAPGTTLPEVMDGFINYTQVLFTQKLMSVRLCADVWRGSVHRDADHWTVEKLEYREVVPAGKVLAVKYAVQPRNVFATGVHRTEQFLGLSTIAEPDRLQYYHFHGGINNRGQVCLEFPSQDPTNSSLFRSLRGGAFEFDDGLARSIPSVREFELETVGRQPFVP